MEQNTIIQNLLWISAKCYGLLRVAVTIPDRTVLQKLMQLQSLCRTQTDLIDTISISRITRNRHPHGEIVDWNIHSKCSWGERLYIPWRIPSHREKKNRKAGEKHTACGEAFEQAGYFFQTGSSSYISTKMTGKIAPAI